MSKLPRNIKPKRLIIFLKGLGFKEVGKRGSHIRLKNPDGRWTQVAVHPKPILQGTLRKIISQTKLSNKELERVK